MAISRVIEVSFRGSSVALVRIDTAYFYNNGIIFKPTDIDLPASYQVHWADNPQASTTLETIGTAEGAPIPDDLWNRSRVIYGWIYLHPTNDSSITGYEVRIYKNVRAGLPDGTEPTPAEQSTIDQLIGALNSAVEQAEDAEERIENMSVSATTLAEGASATVTKSEQDGVVHLAFGIPKGATGDDGYSPTANVSKSGKTATITITDKNGTTSAQVEDGEDGTDGIDGISPSVSVTDITGGHRVVITDKDGTKSFDVEDGATGATPNLTIGTVTTLEPDASATASITGTAEDPVLNLGIPKGQTGEVTEEEFTQLKEDLTALTTKEVVFVDGFSVKTIDGTLFANNRFSYAEIKVATIAGGKINGYTRCERSVNAGIAFYDEYGQFISGEQNPTANTYTWNITNITIPSNAVLLRISCRTDYKTDFNIKFTWEHFDNNIENFITFANEILIKHPNYRYYGETLSFVRNGYNIKQLFAVPAVPSGATTRQGFAIFNGVLFQFFGDNKVSLINMETSDTITTLDVVSEHGDTADFSNDYYNQDDEFPLLYVTADTTPAKVYVNRITRESATLIRTLYFPDTAKTGYYAGHCLDAEANILYIVGYTNSSYDTDDGANKMIVSSWDVTKLTENQDGTFTPSFIELFNTDFISTVQGQSVLNHRLFLLSSRVTSPHETTIFVVDPSKHIISTVISNFPNDIKNVECEGVGFAVSSDGNRYDLIMSGNNYYSIQFT